jgi:DNA-binding transcriptional LysR family regulator
MDVYPGLWLADCLRFDSFCFGNQSVTSTALAVNPEDLAQPYLADGRLSRMLEDWCPYWPGYHLHYASRHQSFPAFAFVDASS